VAERLEVNQSKVLGWIAYGRLKASNVAKGGASAKRLALKDFLTGRAGPSPADASLRRRQHPADRLKSKP
jgi:hypothetical protein